MITAIIQARMSSTRLPGKAMAFICGKPMLWHVVDRVGHSKMIDKIIIATVDNDENKKILDVADDIGVSAFAGSESDVLDRCYKAARQYNTDIIVRITGDCPLIDPCIIDHTVEYFIKNSCDYVSTGHILNQENAGTNYPDGLDTEVCSFKALEKAWKEAKFLSEREHVTSYIWNHPEFFRIKGFSTIDKDLSYLRWTVDEDRDLKFVRAVYDRLYKKDSIFYMKDILTLLEKNPDLLRINSDIKKDEGYFRSLKEDQTIYKL
ncbi:MAG: glycosyltransferase family protein [Candidatus Niyogibacteria bacterium]|nr:glycosyltransferase family protein [Candidatus Niyogibacteria bacterium]